LIKKSWSATYQTFFENENIVAHEVLSPGNLTEAASHYTMLCIS
jgi:hypothetical protein